MRFKIFVNKPHIPFPLFVVGCFWVCVFLHSFSLCAKSISYDQLKALSFAGIITGISNTHSIRLMEMKRTKHMHSWCDAKVQRTGYCAKTMQKYFGGSFFLRNDWKKERTQKEGKQKMDIVTNDRKRTPKNTEWRGSEWLFCERRKHCNVWQWNVWINSSMYLRKLYRLWY